MNFRRTAISATIAVGMAVIPLSTARSQPYYASPLAWPFIAAGAILGTAALIVTAPFRLACVGCYARPYPSLAGPAYFPYYAAPPAYCAPPISYCAAAYPPPSGAPPPLTYSAPAPYGPR